MCERRGEKRCIKFHIGRKEGREGEKKGKSKYVFTKQTKNVQNVEREKIVFCFFLIIMNSTTDTALFKLHVVKIFLIHHFSKLLFL